ncbi:MAG TPA: DUF488 family protein [Candidatus Limnocylindrales bacterium]|jgi:uncharacterized protein YeaO (DUF488 family)|nr:DUF488 family protein [Candidatus Limnocylindrales bacterium]
MDVDVRLSRAYDPPGPDDGRRVLVDRVWPRGRRRDVLQLDGWLREVAPSNDLRHWFGHEPAKWEEFRRRYRAELAGLQAAPLVDQLVDEARRGRLTLVYGAADRERNQAVVLAELIRERAAA